jgi:hypothetical protein
MPKRFNFLDGRVADFCPLKPFDALYSPVVKIKFKRQKKNI